MSDPIIILAYTQASYNIFNYSTFSPLSPSRSVSPPVPGPTLQHDCVSEYHLVLHIFRQPSTHHQLVQGWWRTGYSCWLQAESKLPGPGDHKPARFWWWIAGGHLPLHGYQCLGYSQEQVRNPQENRYANSRGAPFSPNSVCVCVVLAIERKSVWDCRGK